MGYKKLLALFAACVVVLFPNPAHAVPDAAARIKTKISHIIGGSSYLQGASVGVYVKALDTSHVLFARNPNQPMTPASNFKVLTVGVALARLGPDFRYQTQILGPEPDENGVVKGNVYLKGSGDPTWIDPWVRPAEGVLDDFADELHKRGIKKIEGDLVADDSAFDRDFLGRGWKERYLNCDYAAECGALSMNGNIVQVNVEPDSIRTYPKSAAIHVTRSSRGANGVAFHRRQGTNDIHVDGHGSGGSSFTVHNPPMFTIKAFAAVLARHKIGLKGKARLIDAAGESAPSTTQVYATHSSKPLLALLSYLCKESDNFFAQHVFKTLGYHVKNKGTLDNSAGVIKEFMEDASIDTRGLEIADGCGLSVLDHISPRQMVEFLGAMYARPDASTFMSTLSIAGKDGTMKYRLRDYSVWAKTGTINGTCTLCGYVMTKAQQMVAFSIMVNHHHVSSNTIRAFQDEIVKMVAQDSEQI